MMHKPILFKNISFSLSHKTCFDNFNASVPYGCRIGIIGRNGSGKSLLLKMIQALAFPTEGRIILPCEAQIGYVPQIIEQFESLSGGQRFNKLLTQALNGKPNILLLDEPTNHLDSKNKKSLMRMLQVFSGTIFVVSHDIALLDSCVDILWHIENETINIFTGHYSDYIRELNINRNKAEKELSRLAQQNKATHQSLMREQKRAAQSRRKGKKNISQRKWPTVVSHAKANRASKTSGEKKTAIIHKTRALRDTIAEIHLPKVILPTFSLTASDNKGQHVISISNGIVSYKDKTPTLQKVSIFVRAGERVAILGDNASGKSTLLKGIMGLSEIQHSGYWSTPKSEEIGYLDQHYNNLDGNKTVLESILDICPDWSDSKIRLHLAPFLFRNIEQVNTLVAQLSGGEKARLTLAQISAKTPKLLILDEITNNLDLESQEHVVQVLKKYPATLIVVSHDDNFLQKIGITDAYQIRNGTLARKVDKQHIF